MPWTVARSASAVTPEDRCPMTVVHLRLEDATVRRPSRRAAVRAIGPSRRLPGVTESGAPPPVPPSAGRPRPRTGRSVHGGPVRSGAVRCGASTHRCRDATGRGLLVRGRELSPDGLADHAAGRGDDVVGTAPRFVPVVIHPA